MLDRGEEGTARRIEGGYLHSSAEGEPGRRQRREHAAAEEEPEGELTEREAPLALLRA